MDDFEIIQSVLKGNKENFRILVEKYQQVVFRIAIGFVHEKEEAEDLTQEIFIRAWQSLDKFKGDSAFSTWLHRVAVNACLNNARKKRTLPVLDRISSFFNPEAETETYFLPETENPEEIIINKEHSLWLQKALDSLPEKQRIALILSKYDDLPQKEIASIMHLTEGAVEALLQRAKKNLRDKLSSSSKKIKKNEGNRIILFLMKKRVTKMDCRYCKERMDDYMEGKLQKTDEAAFQAHLHTYPECLELFRLQELTEKIITDEKKIVPDFYLTGKIMAKIEGVKDEPDSVLIRVLRPALATISVAAAIMAGVLIGNISGVTADYRMPVELTLLNDAEMESVTVLTAE